MKQESTALLAWSKPRMRKSWASLFLILALVLCNFTISRAQAINQTAVWPSTTWTLSGTYNATALLADPTGVDANLSYDDDAAGIGSTDILQLESPAIDLTAAQTAGENWITISFDYDYNFGDLFDLEYWDADAASWTVLTSIPDNSSTISGWCTSTSYVNFTSDTLDIAAFTATQLSGFKYRFHYDASSVYGWGFCVGPPTILSITPPSCLQPTMITSANITGTTADFSWDAPASGTPVNYHWVVVESGDPLSTIPPTASGTTAHVAGTTTYTEALSGLSGQTSYDVYIVTDCGSMDSSSWIGPTTFTTLCVNINTFPSTEPFDDVPAACWLEGNGGSSSTGPATTGAGDWIEDGFLNNGSTGAARINIYSSADMDWLISPSYEIPAGSSFELSYNVGVVDYASTSLTDPWESDDSVLVMVTTDGGMTWTELLSYHDQNVPSSTGQTESIDLSAYAGETIQFAFVSVEGALNGPSDLDFSIDSLVVGAPVISFALEFENLQAQLIDQHIMIEWSMTGAEQGEAVEVQKYRSNHWETLGSITADNRQNYSYRDGDVEPINTYRISHNDKTSGTVTVMKDGNSAVSIHPNPAGDYVYVELLNQVTDLVIVKIYDMMGREVLSQSIETHSNQVTENVDISRLSAGTYLMRVENAGNTLFSTKLMKR